MIKDCNSNEQKSYVVGETFQPLSEELAITIRQKDCSEVGCIVEVISEMMPYMNPQMGNKLPEMLAAVLNLIKTETKEIEKEYADKDMDEALQE